MPPQRRPAKPNASLRLRIAEEAARILAGGGGGRPSFLLAKRKAAQHLGVPDTRGLPTNEEVHNALLAYQRLFLAERQPLALRRLREVAADAMRFLRPFSPRLVGAVLDGSADEHSEIDLHVFADTVEEVGLFLDAKGIPANLGEHRLRNGDGEQIQRPEYRFIAADLPIAIVVFIGRDARGTPLSPINGRPMRRAPLRELEELLREPPEVAEFPGTSA